MIDVHLAIQQEATNAPAQNSAPGSAPMDFTTTTPGPRDPDFSNNNATADPVDMLTDTVDIDTAMKKCAEAIFNHLGVDVIPLPDGEILRFDDPDKRSGNKNC